MDILFLQWMAVPYKFQSPKENVRVFGGNPNQTQKQSPLASVSVLYDVSNDVLVDVSLHSYRYSERESAKKHMKYLSMVSNPIVLFDRGYPSETFFHFLQIETYRFLCVFLSHTRN